MNELADDAPFYDDRGNVRPRGTKGARPRSYEERVEIAQRLADGSWMPTVENDDEGDDVAVVVPEPAPVDPATRAEDAPPPPTVPAPVPWSPDVVKSPPTGDDGSTGGVS
jgi:hypothetical protein